MGRLLTPAVAGFTLHATHVSISVSPLAPRAGGRTRPHSDGAPPAPKGRSLLGTGFLREEERTWLCPRLPPGLQFARGYPTWRTAIRRATSPFRERARSAQEEAWRHGQTDGRAEFPAEL